MKIFRVVTEKDGEVTKKGGKRTTDIIQVNRRFAAVSIEEVWEYLNTPGQIDWEEEDLKAIVEEHPAITILRTTGVDFTGAVIEAAERYAAKYNGDERPFIKADILNAYYQGAQFGKDF